MGNVGIIDTHYNFILFHERCVPSPFSGSDPTSAVRSSASFRWGKTIWIRANSTTSWRPPSAFAFYCTSPRSATSACLTASEWWGSGWSLSWSASAATGFRTFSPRSTAQDQSRIRQDILTYMGASLYDVRRAVRTNSVHVEERGSCLVRAESRDFAIP